MPAKQQERVMSQAKSAKAGTKAAGKKGAAGDDDEAALAAAKRKKLIVIGLVAVLAAAAGWYFFLRPNPAEANAEPKPGEVLALDAISVNLAEGHYLRIGVALQQVEGGGGGHGGGSKMDGSQALDLTISTFSGQTTEALADPKHREELRKELTEKVKHAYHDEVMAVYFTEFVTQ